MDNLLNKNTIDEALKFYDIKDNHYQEQCYQCLEFIKQNSNFSEKVKSIYHILYIDKEDKIRSLWKHKKMEELFGDSYHPFITNLLLLLGYKIHMNNINKYSFDEEQILVHKKRVKETLTHDINIRKMDGIRISQMLWGIYFTHVRIIEVGRLQYELIHFDPIQEEIRKDCIKIHIPKGTKLVLEEVQKSLEDSKVLIKKYFQLENPEYYCISWLLSKQIINLLDEDSNILKFSRLFDTKEGNSCISDILDFVFKITNVNDYNNLIEETSLQRKIKKILLNNQDIKIGMGRLKK